MKKISVVIILLAFFAGCSSSGKYVRHQTLSSAIEDSKEGKKVNREHYERDYDDDDYSIFSDHKASKYDDDHYDNGNDEGFDLDLSLDEFPIAVAANYSKYFYTREEIERIDSGELLIDFNSNLDLFLTAGKVTFSEDFRYQNDLTNAGTVGLGLRVGIPLNDNQEDLNYHIAFGGSMNYLFWDYKNTITDEVRQEIDSDGLQYFRMFLGMNFAYNKSGNIFFRGGIGPDFIIPYDITSSGFYNDILHPSVGFGYDLSLGYSF